MEQVFGVIGIISLIVAFILASVVVNAAQRLIMKILGANVMFFNGKSKLILIIIVAIIIASPVLNFLNGLMS